jgi:MFS family permease
LGYQTGYIVLTWLVFAETRSAFDVALLAVAQLVPLATFGIFAGALVDRYSRLRLMVLADALRAAALAAVSVELLLFGFHFVYVVVVVFIIGMGTALFRPSLNSFVPQAVPPEELGTANGLLQAAQQMASVAGSPLGGILITTVGVALALAFNTAVYLASTSLIFATSLVFARQGGRTAPKAEERPPYIRQLREGFEYLRGQRALLKLTLASLCANFFLGMFYYFLVVYVSDVLSQGSLTFGILSSAAAIGVVIGSLLVGRLGSEGHLGRNYALYWGVAGVAILGLVLVPQTTAAFVFLFIYGAAGGLGNTTFVVGVQKVVPNNLLGRYLSLDTAGSQAASPAGQLTGGLVIPLWGLSFDYAVAAAGTAAFCFGLLLFPDVRGLGAESPTLTSG